MIISLICQNCSSETEKQIFYYPTGEIWEIGYYEKQTGKQTGVWQTFDKRGKLLTEEAFKNDLLHGESKTFYPNGNLRSIKIFHQGQLISDIQFYPNGNKKVEGEFMTIYHDGYQLSARKDKWSFFNENEDIDSIVHYRGIEHIRFDIDTSNGIIDSVIRIHYQKETIFSE